MDKTGLLNQIKENAFKDELEKIAKEKEYDKKNKKAKHPVSEAQRRWAFWAEEEGDLPKGKAMKWSRRAKGKDLPKHAEFIKNASIPKDLEKRRQLLEEDFQEHIDDKYIKPFFKKYPHVNVAGTLGTFAGAGLGGSGGYYAGKGIQALTGKILSKAKHGGKIAEGVGMAAKLIGTPIGFIGGGLTGGLTPHILAMKYNPTYRKDALELDKIIPKAKVKFETKK